MGLKRTGVLLDSEVPMSRDTFQLERTFRVQNVDSFTKKTN